MKKAATVEEYIENNTQFKDALVLLRDIINTTELTETIKWSTPTYCLNGKNVLSIGAFKAHFCIWFFNGVFLKDEHNRLVTAQEKTKALRQMRFTNLSDIDKPIVLLYIKEAINNQKLGKELKPTKTTTKDISIPLELKSELDKNSVLFDAFKMLSLSKQKEYCEHIATAKREATKLSRLDKIKSLIIKGVGLHDKYKNC